MSKTMRVKVPYNHDPNDLGGIDLALAERAKPTPGSWRPAFRDIDKGKKIVFVDFPVRNRLVTVWVRDGKGGPRAVKTMTV